MGRFKMQAADWFQGSWARTRGWGRIPVGANQHTSHNLYHSVDGGAGGCWRIKEGPIRCRIGSLAMSYSALPAKAAKRRKRRLFGRRESQSALSRGLRRPFSAFFSFDAKLVFALIALAGRRAGAAADRPPWGGWSSIGPRLEHQRSPPAVTRCDAWRVLMMRV